jgi:hypothetical protein
MRNLPSKVRPVSCYGALKRIPTLSPQDRVKLINILGKDIVKSLCECALNIVHEKVKIPKSIQSAYKKEEKNIRALIDNKTPLKKKKKILVQKGGALLPLLVQPVLGILGSILADKIFTKKS